MAIATAIEVAKSVPVLGADFGGESTEISPTSLI